MSSYEGPSWAVAPADQKNNSNHPAASQQQPEWILTEIKSGVEVARYDLASRPFTLIGRDADACPIVLQHESCSRLHARIAFDGISGVPWLRDLQSTHGTTVNKKGLPPLACGKLESTSTNKTGARGVVLYPSDVLQFGASSRIYCLEGPEEFARGAKKLLQKQQEANRLLQGGDGDVSARGDTTAAADSSLATEEALIKQKKQGQEKESTGVSWGMDMDDHHQDDSQMDENAKNQGLLPTNLDESKIPERHRKEWDRLRALRYKLENIQEESSRILRKGREDLTEGQERQLVRNQQREETLQQDIVEKEAVLYRKIFPDKVAASQRQTRDRSVYAEEDEVEDRTGDEAQRIQEGIAVANERNKRRKYDDDDAEDEESLRTKRSLLLEKRRGIQARISHAQDKSSILQARINRLQAAGDGEECFFVQNDLDIALDALSKGQKEQAAVDKLLAQTDRLLKIVNPKFDFSESSNNGHPSVDAATTKPLTDPPAAEVMPAPSMIPPPPPPIMHAKKLGKPLVVDAPEAESVAVVANDSSVETISLAPPPPPKRPRVLGPSMPPPPSMSTKSTGSTAAQVEKKRPRPKGSTLDVLSASLSTTSTASPLSASASASLPHSHKQTGIPTKTTPTAVKPPVALTRDEEKHDQWVKPKDQDGSGMTKLNQKFAGRY